MENETRLKLRKPLPPEAIKPHPSKTYLSTIKAIYVTERFNEVFGVDGWSIKTDVIHWFEKPNAKGKIEYTVMSKTIFSTATIYHECIAGSTNEDLGDAAKGATTDAITKIGSYLEVGIDVFKGLNTKPTAKPATTTKPLTKEALTPKHPQWAYVLGRVKTDKVPLATIEQSFTLSEEVKKLLE